MNSLCNLSQVPSHTSDEIDNAYKPFLLYADSNRKVHSTNGNAESIPRYLTVYTGGEDLVPMSITRAGPAFMFSQYNMMMSLPMRMEKMMNMSTNDFVTFGVLLPSKERQMFLILIPTSLDVFIHIQIYLIPILTKYYIKVSNIKLQPQNSSNPGPITKS